MIKVLIWENSWGPLAMKHPGHAAVAVMQGPTPSPYISWWPNRTDAAPAARAQLGYRPGLKHEIGQDFIAELGPRARAALTANPAGARPGQIQDTDPFYDANRIYVDNPDNDWMKTPTQVIAIQSCDDVEDLGAGRTMLGLNESNMTDWWELYTNTVINAQAHHEYNFISQRYNCASIAMAALLAGGADLFVKPSKQWIYYSPNDIRDYARKLSRKITEINNQAQAIQNGILSEFRRYQAPSRQRFGIDYLHQTGGQTERIVEIWRTEEWRRQSAVTIGRRKEQIQLIDQAMVQYWSFGTGWTATNFINKAVYISAILEQVQSHLIEKPKSDRREAVLKLGSQCMQVIKYHASKGQAQRDNLMMSIGTTFGV